MAARPLKTPVQVTSTIAALNKSVCGKTFKKDNALVVKYFDDLKEEEKKEHSARFAEAGELKIEVGGKEFTLTKDHISFSEQTKTVHEEKYIPHVIEPSFGIGRIVYCVFEHCFKVRPDDAQRTFFDFPPLVAPLKCSILPLMNNSDMNKKVQEIKRTLIAAGVSNKVDDSGQTVGKRYARTDECGIPFAITVDFDTLKDETVTMRELASMKQVRLPIADVAATILSLVNTQSTWDNVVEKYGLFSATKDEEKKE